MDKQWYQHILTTYFDIDEFFAKSFLEEVPEEKFFEEIINQKLSSEELVLVFLKTKYNISKANILEKYIDEKNMQLIDVHKIIKYNVLPFFSDDKNVYIATSEPFNDEITYNLKHILKDHSITYFFDTSINIKNTIEKLYDQTMIGELSNIIHSENLDNPFLITGEESPISILFKRIFSAAVTRYASDIHIEPFANTIRIRFRIDGKLRTFQNLELDLLPILISRLKILCKMDISKKMSPQDGHFKIEINNKKMDFRVSTLPTIFGEKAVIRAIYENAEIFSKDKIGFSKEDLLKINAMLSSYNGVILVTGPTGSGKTTTLSSLIADINNDEVNIITIEDPVENIINGVSQVSLNEKAGVTFKSILPYLLRQDPDIIMIGEIRDLETANLVMKSSVTGHLVLSTFHTNNAVATITRLLDMKIEPYLISSAIKGIISQKLIRRLCPKCKKKRKITEFESKIFGLDIETTIFESVGCVNCENTGYFGRFLVYELIKFDEKIQRLILNGFDEMKLKKYLEENNYVNLEMCGVNWLKNGETSADELTKVLFKK